MTYSVFLADDAQQDLLAIYRYISRHDSIENANRLLALIEKSVSRLSSLPQRGHYPPELERVGIRGYREIICKPFRIIYDISDSDVFVHCILDSRRDLIDILHRRLVR
jgi:toxin ParE1/3/4